MGAAAALCMLRCSSVGERSDSAAHVPEQQAGQPPQHVGPVEDLAQLQQAVPGDQTMVHVWADSAPTGQTVRGEGKLVEIRLPEPERFDAGGGRSGWRIRIPGKRPLATPAVSDGVLYVGGGFGSHEFYALDARTGGPVWTFKTGDDGPTAAVVAEGCVAYNTESCTLYVQDAGTGKVLWHRWLGDPLMSQPAVADGRLFMAYPGKDRSHHLAAFELRTGKVLWDARIAAEVITAPVADGGSVYAATADGTLYRFAAEDGKLHWSDKCNVTSAPRVADHRLIISQRAVRTIEIATGEGEDAGKQTSESTVEGYNIVDAKTGKLAHDEPQAAVKAAYLLGLPRAQRVFLANYTVTVSANFEWQGMASGAYALLDEAPIAAGQEAAHLKSSLARLAGQELDRDVETNVRFAREAQSLAAELEGARTKDLGAAAKLRAVAQKMRTIAAKSKEAALTAQDVQSNLGAMKAEQEADQAQDASVGFSSAPAAANLQPAVDNLGKGNVKAVWAYQGSRPCMFGPNSISVNGDTFRSVNTRTGQVVWEKKIESERSATRPATPAALAGGKLYFGTADGRIVCADPKDGGTLWEAKVGGNIIFEPAVVGGCVYVATNEGVLVCLETGDPSADGWAMWGGSARHNGP
jgi:outer membrane protein assembly factor BamB